MIDHQRRIIHHFLNYHLHATDIVDRVQPEHFQDKTLRQIYSILMYFFSQAKYLLTVDSIIDEIKTRSKDLTLRAKLVDAVLECTQFVGSTKADLDHAIDCMLTARRREVVLTNLGSLANKLASSEKDLDIHEELVGLWNAVSDQSRGEVLRNIGRTSHDALRRYDATRLNERSSGIPTAFPSISKLLQFRRKHFWIWAAYTSHGKTRFAIENAYHLGAIGKRVVYVSLEIDDVDVEAILHARHSHAFGTPIEYDKILTGTLNAEEEQIYKKVVADFARFDITIWTPGRVTIDDIRRRISALQVEKTIDLVIIDYLQLVYPEEKNGSRKEDVGELMREAKALARREDICVMALHQMSREGYKNALERGYYEMFDLSESAEAERNADLVGWNLMTPEMRLSNELKFGVCKNRHGQIMIDGCLVYTDFATGLITERAENVTGTEFFESMIDR